MKTIEFTTDVHIPEEEVIAIVAKHFYPEQVFSMKELETWAEENDFKREE